MCEKCEKWGAGTGWDKSRLQGSGRLSEATRRSMQRKKDKESGNSSLSTTLSSTGRTQSTEPSTLRESSLGSAGVGLGSSPVTSRRRFNSPSRCRSSVYLFKILTFLSLCSFLTKALINIIIMKCLVKNGQHFTRKKIDY